MTTTALLLTSWLFGGMAAFSAGFAPLLFRLLPMAEARPLLRGAFPHYYAALICLAALAAAAALPVDPLSAGLLAAVAVSTVWARQDLMHRVNAATDRGDAAAFTQLHGLSVGVQLAQLGAAAWALVRIAF
jgi:hypothetical protein